METTLALDEQLLDAAMRRAAALGTTLSEVVNQALREALGHEAPACSAFQMITYGDPSAPCHHEPADFADVAMAEDVGR